ncbi:hypothetical protein MMC10_001113 [Thelotrema lepadinum]|nr:hypothetical protein [Thelotrema lepadinum]
MSKKQKESLSWFSWDTLDVADQNLLDPNIREAGHGRLTTRKKATSGQLKPPHTKPLRISYPSNFTPNWYRATIIKNVESWHLYEMNYNSGGCELDCDEDGYPVFYSTFGNLIVEPGHPNCMAIARTCTRLRDIAMRVYYSENTFTFTDTAAMELFASHLSYFERSGAMIRNMSLEVDQFSMMWKGKEKQSKFFSPMESSEENGEPQVKTHFAYMFPNVQYLEIDFFKARNDWNFGGKGTMEFIDVLRHHVRVPRARILNVSHLPEYSRSVEKELMGLEALDDGLAELISIENTPGLNNPLSKRMLRETREGKFVSVTLA